MSVTQPEFTEAMDSFFTGLGGPVGVMVDHLDIDLELEYNADDLYPTASTLKTPLLYELYRQAEEGKIDLTERITLTHGNRVPGSGVLQHLDEGLQPTIRDLAELMIIVSDNWATDMIYECVGKESMAARLKEIGLNNTFIPMNIREMFCTLADKDPNDPEVTYDSLKEHLKVYRASDDSLAFAADSRNDVSSPRDMAKLARLIHEGHGLTEESRAGVLRILKNQNFNTVIPGRLPLDEGIETAHKTGSLRGVKADAGMVYSPKVNYCIAFMSKQQEDSAETTDRMAHASRWVWDRLSG
jgi:beta-lactamase class A